MKTLFVASLIFITGISTVCAQGISANVAGLEFDQSISNPMPGQEVTITARSFSMEINGANITWIVDGKTIQKGLGLTQLKVKAPAMGKSMTISATAVDTDGATIRNSLTITTVAIDMIIEPAGYLPAMFPGKILPVYQNSVKIVAIPHMFGSNGLEMDPKTLIYTWEQSDKVIESASGYGKQSATFAGATIPRPYAAKVTVTSRDGTRQSSAVTTISPTSPFIAFYKNDPLYGPLFNKSISQTMYLGSQRETGVLAVPYGFTMPANGIGNLVLNWFINNREHPELSLNQSVTLRSPEGTAGTSNIELDISHKDNILQTAKASFTAVFSANASTTNAAF